MSSPQRFLVFENKDRLNQYLTPGSKLKLKIKGKPICVVRDDQKLIAFHDQCPHMSESLYSGFLNSSGEIVCPWHAYRFNLITGLEVERRCSGLKFLDMKEEEGRYFIYL